MKVHCPLTLQNSYESVMTKTAWFFEVNDWTQTQLSAELFCPPPSLFLSLSGAARCQKQLKGLLAAKHINKERKTEHIPVL